MADRPDDYAKQLERENTLRLREMLGELPALCRGFFTGIEPSTTALTRLAYAYDLRLFFRYLNQSHPAFAEKPIAQIRPADLNHVEAADIESFLSYLSYHEQNGNDYQNHEPGKARKLAAVRALFNYLYKKRTLQSDATQLVDSPKLREKAIIRLEPDEVARLLDIAESGEKLSERQRLYQRNTRERDVALLTLLLGTGIRVSECVGVDLDDIDFSQNALRVHRKGGKESIVYFWDEVEQALRTYLEKRGAIAPEPGHEQALFLSLQRRRITPRAVQLLVEKYARVAAPLKRITPHKLRSTFGTSLYRETGDIYLVANVLGHSDVNTTRKHYAAIDEDNRRQAARRVRLRDDPD